MSLLEVRKHFIEFTGRLDLVLDDESYENNGADFFIHSGQRWLDTHFDIGKSHGRYDKLVPIGTWYLLIPNIRTIENVWVSNNTGSKWRASSSTYNDIKNNWNGSPSTMEIGGILEYAPAYFRNVQYSQSTTLVDVFGDTQYIITDSGALGYNGIIFLPPTMEQVNIEVEGLFYQPKLIQNTDTNFWSEEQDMALVLAAARAVESSYRNTQGVKDYEESIKSELLGIEFDFAHELSNNIRSMGE